MTKIAPLFVCILALGMTTPACAGTVVTAAERGLSVPSAGLFLSSATLGLDAFRFRGERLTVTTPSRTITCTTESAHEERGRVVETTRTATTRATLTTRWRFRQHTVTCDVGAGEAWDGATTIRETP